jgi:hypothetical protein
MCTSTPSIPLNCAGTYSKDGTSISSFFLPDNDFSTLTLYNLASHIQSKVFPFILVFAGVLFLASFFVLVFIQQQLKRGPTPARRKAVKKTFKYLLWISVALNIAVAAGSQQAADALQWGGEVGMGRLEITSGTTLLGLQWTIVAFSVVFAGGSAWIYNGKGGEKNADEESQYQKE